MRDDRPAAQIANLIDFFRNEGAQLGQEGDDKNLTPTGAAIHFMRELTKVRAEINLTRLNGTLRAPVVSTCARGHRTYREVHSKPDCVYCLQLELNRVQGKLDAAKAGVGMVWDALK